MEILFYMGLVARGFNEYRVHKGHIYREGNTVADIVSTYQDFDNYIWWDVISDFILKLLIMIYI